MDPAVDRGDAGNAGRARPVTTHEAPRRETGAGPYEERPEQRSREGAPSRTSWMTVTCGKCGQAADIDEWTNTPVAGPLPPGVYQCPNCGFAFQRREVEKGKIIETAGRQWYLPGRLALVPCQTRM